MPIVSVSSGDVLSPNMQHANTRIHNYNQVPNGICASSELSQVNRYRDELKY